MQLPACLAKFLLQKWSVDLGFKLLSFPYCLENYHKFVFVFFLTLMVVALRIRTVTFLTKNLSSFLLRIIFFIDVYFFGLLKGLFRTSLTEDLLLNHISFSFLISIALHKLLIHLPNYLAVLFASRHAALPEHPFLLFFYFICVFEPTLCLQHFYKVVPLLIQIPMLTSPTKLI